MNKEFLKHKINHDFSRGLAVSKWILLAVLLGLILGVIGGIFSKCLSYVTTFRLNNPYILLLLPVGAVIIRLFYKVCGYEKDQGTNLVLSAIHSGDRIPLRMFPLIFVSTVFSHLCGASVGREGAALQIGGSVGAFVGRGLKFNEQDETVIIMCGMSAAFSAVFGTPMAAAVFSMEVVSVGIMHYSALVPCVVASFTARGVAAMMGISASSYDIIDIPALGVISATKISLLAILCGFVSILFCVSLRQTEALYQKLMPNLYLRSFIGGVVVLLLTILVGKQTYNGAGIDVINSCLNGEVHSLGFLMKILFTALTIAAGYKGGEIVPSFFIGASFGSMFGSLVGISPSLCAAVGMGAVFCGVTNSPITSLLICLELFGMEGMPYYLFAIAFSYMVSGYYGLYSSQKIVYSKYKSNYINKKTH